MEKIDAIKELIGYMKVIFALVAATAVGLAGWFAQNYDTADSLLVYSGLFIICLLIFILLFINNKIVSDIEKLKGI